MVKLQTKFVRNRKVLLIRSGSIKLKFGWCATDNIWLYVDKFWLILYLYVFSGICSAKTEQQFNSKHMTNSPGPNYELWSVTLKQQSNRTNRKRSLSHHNASAKWNWNAGIGKETGTQGCSFIGVNVLLPCFCGALKINFARFWKHNDWLEREIIRENKRHVEHGCHANEINHNPSDFIYQLMWMDSEMVPLWSLKASHFHAKQGLKVRDRERQYMHHGARLKSNLFPI